MIDWLGIKKEQQAQGGMRFYVRGQKRMKRWVEEQEQAGTEGNGEAEVKLKDYVEVLRRVDEARQLGEDTKEVLKDMNPGAQPTMAAAALGEWLAGGEERGARSGGRRRNRIRSDTENATAVAERVARSGAHRGRKGSHKEERHNPTAGE